MELPRVGRTSNARERLLEAMRELIWTGSYGSTSVDQICLRAGVKKGSFYHFFESKSALALAAIDFGWSEYRVKLDALINSEMSPLERLLAGFRDQRIQQRTMQERHGRVLGCPIHSLGCEVATTDPVLYDRLQKILTEILHYYETTIREGQEEGLIVRGDAAQLARLVLAFAQGLLLRARITNDLSALDDLEAGAILLLSPENSSSSHFHDSSLATAAC